MALNIPNGASVPVGMGQGGIPMKMGKLSPVDVTLTMLAEYCKKTVATVGGDGYTEWVLNRRTDGSLQLDYYRNYVGYEEEIHESVPAPEDTWDKIVAIKDKYQLKNPPPERSFGMCGGSLLVKIREGDSVIRLEWGGLTTEEQEAFTAVRDILTEYVYINNPNSKGNTEK